LKPQSAKSKGRNLQKWTRDTILGVNPELKENDVLSRSMGANGEDVILSPAARLLAPIKIECKNKREIAVCGWYEQAGGHDGEYEPVLVIKENYEEPLVVVDAVYFFKLLRRAQQVGNV
jgi:hypothetical protein